MLKHLILKLYALSEKTSSDPAFCIKKSYKHRLKPKYFLDNIGNKSGTIWQPEVYEVSGTLAKMFDCRNIIDLGCGNAEKLVKLYPTFNIIGIDFGKNIQQCKAQYDFGKWINADLDSPDPIDISKDVLKDSTIICSDVIEHLENPSHLLNNLKIFLNYCPICIITTPERDLARGKKHNGPPTNLHHIREWNLLEFNELLKLHDFNIYNMGLTASNNKNYEKKTILVVLSNNNVKNKTLTLNELNFKHTTFLPL